MAQPRYRIIDTKGAYMALDPAPQLLALGADHNAAAVYGIRAPVYTLFRQGTEIDFDGVPGPHLAPLNAEAEAKMRAYWAKYPGATLDPTRHMPLGQDPMGGRSIEQSVAALLEGMQRDLAGAAPAQDAQAAQIAALVDGQRAMMAAVAQLTAVLAQLAPALQPVKGRAA
jgi:hypothetical protein